MPNLWGIVKQAVGAFVADGVLSRGAAIAYYSVFAIAPILVIVIALAGFVFGADAARNAIVQQFSGLMGPEAAALLQQMVQSASDVKAGMLSAAISIVTLIVTSTGVFGEMQAALNAIWHAPAPKSPLSIILRARLVSLGLVLALGFLLIASLIISAALAALSDYLRDVFPLFPIVLAVVDTIVSLSLITVLVAAIYKFLPDVPIAWEEVWVGSIVTAILLTIGKWLIGLYVGSSAVTTTYGAAGALVVVLLWVYYCAQIFLLGAEFTYAHSQWRVAVEASPNVVRR